MTVHKAKTLKTKFFSNGSRQANCEKKPKEVSTSRY